MSKNIRHPNRPSDHGPGPHYSQPQKQEIVFHGLIMAAAVVMILAGVKAASGIIAPMLLALFATIILLVPLRWLQSKGCPSVLSLIIVLGCVAIVFLGFSRLVVSSITELSKESRIYAKRIEREFNRIEDMLEQWGYRLNFGLEKTPTEEIDNLHPDDERMILPPETDPQEPNAKDVKSENQTSELPPTEPKPDKTTLDSQAIETPETTVKTVAAADPDETVDEDKNLLDHARTFASSLLPPHDDEPIDEEELEQLQPTIQQPTEPSLIDLNAQSLMNWFTMTVNEVRHLVEKGFLVMIITLFMIFEASRFPAKIDRAFGKGPITNEHLHHIASEIRRYLFLKAISSLMSATAATAVYLFFGVPAALFWGLIAFFLYFIPNIGGIIASIVPGLLIFMQWGPVGVLAYAVCLVAIECTIGYGIEPKILGHGLGISTVVIILSLITWGWLLGAIGLFLAAPLTIMVKIILQAFKETEWIAILIGDGSKRSG